MCQFFVIPIYTVKLSQSNSLFNGSFTFAKSSLTITCFICLKILIRAKFYKYYGILDSFILNCNKNNRKNITSYLQD